MNWTLSLLAASTSWAAVAASLPLEWNATYSTAVPYEVDLSPAKLARLGGVRADASFVVKAETATGDKLLPVQTFDGRQPGDVTLRFAVPAGTRRLVCDTVDRPAAKTDAATVDNLFAGALAKAENWKATANAQIAVDPAGVTIRGTCGADVRATCRVPVPENLAGQPVFLEIDVMNVAKMTSGNPLYIRQLDEKGDELPEALSDPRWLSHMRPPRKLVKLREAGRLHPRARALEVWTLLKALGGSVDEYGLPVRDKSDLWPALRFTRLAVRPAAKLPFPKYDDSFFAPGPSGRAEDAALVLGGDRAFWYDTHSLACWSQAKQFTDPTAVFFPEESGTVEAWLKPDWKDDRTYNIFTASHRYNSNESRLIQPKFDCLTLKYRPGTRTFSFVIVDWNGRPFTKTVTADCPAGRWCHVALAWKPGGTADFFLDGRRLFALPLEGFEPWSLAKHEEVKPNARIPLEFYVGANYVLGRVTDGFPSEDKSPFYPGAIDNLRVSSGVRYTADFTPATAFAVDADTRALFTFDRSFDGVSGGGCGFIPGTLFAKTDRVAHELVLDGRKVAYFPAEIAAANDPFKVLSTLNYPNLPSVDDFKAARRRVERTFTMKNGDVVRVACPAGTVPDSVEIANTTDAPLVYPVVVNRGEFDPRSFGDLADSLMNGHGDYTDRERANAVFQFVLGASDYFMQHTITFPPDSDRPESVVYKALMMLNGYCGFECGPLNNMAANFLACVARCPASQTAGYGHSFEQVHFDGKNHTYDLSAQKFFPAMDNETAACLSESEDQPGLHNRLGGDSGSFIRSYTRGYEAQNPSYQAKVAMILNPGERFRVVQANDGHVNDLHIHRWLKGEQPERSSYREDYASETHAQIADPKRNFLTRMDRWFPHYLNGFLVFDGRPAADNPAFGQVTADSFCYRVQSCYPIVHGEYAAYRADGTRAEIEISTDGLKTFRAVPEALDYEVRARVAYWIRVKAPIAAVARFAAVTETMINPRVFPGRLHAGENELLFKATPASALGLPAPSADAAGARVTVAWREPAKAIEIKGGVSTGVIPGLEKQVVFLDPAKPQTLPVTGLSAAARVTSFPLKGAAGAGAAKGIDVRLAQDALVLAAGPQTPDPSIACVRLLDGDAVKDLYVVVSSKMRFVPAAAAQVKGGAKRIAAGGDQLQETIWCERPGDGATFPFAAVPAGDYTVFFVDRFASDTASPGELNRQIFAMDWPGRRMKGSILSGAGGNQGVNLYKARYGKLVGRANFKWDYVLDDVPYHPYFPRYRPRVLTFAQPTDAFTFTVANGCEKGAELACALIVPKQDRAFYCEMMKLLCGMNTDPAKLQ